MGSLTKAKDIKVELSGFGAGIDSTAVEYTNIGLPDTKEDEETEIVTNLHTYADTEEKKGFEPWSKLQIFVDSTGTAYNAAVAAKEAGSTGTVKITGGGITINRTAKISKVVGGDADAGGFMTSFTPTFVFLDDTNIQ